MVVERPHPLRYRGDNLVRALTDAELVTLLDKKKITLGRIIQRDTAHEKQQAVLKQQGW